ncbi:MAG: tetratricopeptide repeat protein, partial [Phycisphaerales bacterium]
MTSTLTSGAGFRRHVFIAAAPSLATERQAATSAVFAGGPHGGRFAVADPDAGASARQMIDHAIRTSDFFLLILNDHWREPRHGAQLEYADVESEFELAWACLEDDTLPMSGIGVLFRRIDEDRLKAPSFQLQQVQLFRRHIERTGRAFVGEFDQLAELSLMVKQCLGTWESARGKGLGNPSAQTRLGDSAMPLERADLITEAMRLADAGRLAGAEACFALAVSRGDDVAAHVAYGRFLRRLGRLTQALEVLEQAVEYAEDSRSPAALEHLMQALTQLTQIYLSLGDHAKAEACNRRAAQLANDQKDAKGEAAALGNDGAMLKARG